MDLFRLLSRGVEHSGVRPYVAARRALRAAKASKASQRARVIAKAREQWLNALLVDETRGWLSTFEEQPQVLSGLCVVLTLAALAKEHEAGSDAPDVRVIRGAVSAIEQCGNAGNVLTPEVLQALSVAAQRARRIILECTDGAIEAASVQLHASVQTLES